MNRSLFARILTLASTALLTLLALPDDALAYDIGPGTSSSGAITGISKGVKELGFESMFGLGYDKIGTASATRVSLLAGGTFRYFVIDNLNLGLNVSFLYKRAGAIAPTSDIGGVATLSGAYYASLGGGMFFKPLIGVGGFYGGRTDEQLPDPVTGDEVDPIRSTIAGFAARGGLGLAFYASPKFSLHAGPEGIVFLGSATPEKGGGPSESFLSVDGGFNVGMSYVF